MYFYNIKQVLRMFELPGLNPENNSKWQTIKFFIIILGCISIIYLVVKFLVFKEQILVSNIADTLESIELIIHGMAKGIGIFINKSKILDLLTKMKNHFWEVEDITDEKERNHQIRSLKFLKTVFYIYIGGCLMTASAFLGKPLIREGKHTAFESYRADWFPYYVLLAFEYFVYIYGLYFPIVATDLFIFTIFFLTSFQFRMLNSEMEGLFVQEKNEQIIGTNNNKKFLEARIKKCVEHHRFLQDYVQKMNDAFSLLLFGYNGIIILSMCVDMYIISIEDSIQDSVKSMIYTVNGILEYTFCYCMPAQAITDEAEKIGTSAYFSKWYDFPGNSIKIAILMMINSGQKPMIIIACGFLKINMETCMKTVQTMVSYCMFLRTMDFVE